MGKMAVKIRGEEYFDVEDLERILGLTPHTLRLYFKTKIFKGKKLGKKWIISNTNLKLFLDS